MTDQASILIVDDEPNILLSLQFLMKKAGYDVRTAGDGEQALAEIARAKPDLVLLDVMMPKLDGFTVCQRIRATPEWQDVRIIMLTARGRDVEREKGLALGADDYITKPFSTNDAIEPRRSGARQVEAAVRPLTAARGQSDAPARPHPRIPDRAVPVWRASAFAAVSARLQPAGAGAGLAAALSLSVRGMDGAYRAWRGDCSADRSRRRGRPPMADRLRSMPRLPWAKALAMLSGPVIVLASLLYLGLLFAIARYGDKRADAGRSIIATPYVYALSIAVYCTSWTFFGSVGRAASSGVDFLPIYLGPTLTFILGWIVIRKIIRISKVNRITSIADFIASRYGKSFELGIVVSVIAVVGILPYISLQLKAISTSFSILLQYPEVVAPKQTAPTSILAERRPLCSTRDGGIRHLVRHAPYRCQRAPRGHGCRDRLRIGRQAHCLPGGGLVRHVRAVQRLCRHLRPGGDDCRARPVVRDRRRRRSYQLAHADAVGYGGDRGAAPPVPGPSGRECRRAASEEGDVAVPTLPSPDQYLRFADCFRRPHAFPRWRRRRRHVRPHHRNEGAAAVCSRCWHSSAASPPPPA